MKTFILFWNPDISNVKLDGWKAQIDNEDLWGSWSVWEHEQAHNGDRFFLVRCGEGNTGICESGHFYGEPFKGEDWSGQDREVYYIELNIDTIIDSEYCPVLTTTTLQKEFPDFDWSGGHSGRMLPEEYAERLETLWSSFLEENDEIFHRHAIRENHFIEDDEEDDEEMFVLDGDEDDEFTEVISLLDNGEIKIVLKDKSYDDVTKVKTKTFQEAQDTLSHYTGDAEVEYEYYIEENDDIDRMMMPQFLKALDLSSQKHRDKKDKAGHPYFGHVVRVTKACKSQPAVVVALLQDVVEDTDVTLDMMEELGFFEFVLKAVDCLTHKDEESYEDYIKRLAPNPIAREVKVADLEDNMDIRRLDGISEKDTERLNRYINALKYLKNYKA